MEDKDDWIWMFNCSPSFSDNTAAHLRLCLICYMLQRFCQWWKVTKYFYSSTALKYNFEVCDKQESDDTIRIMIQGLRFNILWYIAACRHGDIQRFFFLNLILGKLSKYKEHITIKSEQRDLHLSQFFWGMCTLLEYFHFMLLYTSTPLHLFDRYSYTKKQNIWSVYKIQFVKN